MAYNRDGEETDYRTLADLIEDLMEHPGELFLLDRGCEALVYIAEREEILLISCRSVLGSREVREETLRQKLNRILEEE